MSTEPDIETKLRESIVNRRACDFSVGSDIDKIDNSDQWGPERTIEADALRAVWLSKKVEGAIGNHPLEITGARLVGHLDLRGASVSRPLYLLGCDLKDVWALNDARLATISLAGCKVVAIRAHRAQVDGSLLIRGCEFSGPLSVIGAAVKGDVDLRGSKFGEASPIEADRLRVDGAVYLRDGFCSEAGVRMEGARIGSALDGSGGIFRNKTDPALFINSAEIGSFCTLRGASIESESAIALSAEGVQIKHFLSLAQASVKRTVFLRGGQIGSNLNLLGVTIENPAAIENPPTIENPGAFSLELERIRVMGDILVRPDEFQTDTKELKLIPARFSGGIRMTSAFIGGSLVIEKAIIRNGNLFFNRINVSSLFRFAQTEVRDGRMSLANAKVFALSDDLSSWPQVLGLGNFDYSTLSGDAPTGWRQRLEWLRCNKTPVTPSFNPQPFTHLATVLRRTGNERDAKMIAISRHREARRRMRTLSPNWLGSIILEVTCGHGYRPSLAAAWALLFICVGWGIFARADFVPLKDAALALYRDHKPLPKDYAPFRPLTYSADTFLPIVNLQQKDYWGPDASTRSGSRAWFYRTFHILAGWFFTTLFVAGVTGLIRRD
jgi:hypothetical protein